MSTSRRTGRRRRMCARSNFDVKKDVASETDSVGRRWGDGAE